MLATELEDGEHGVPQDQTKAERLYERGCDLNSARSCVLAAVMIEDARGVRRDPTRSARLRQRAETIEKVAPKPTVTPAEVAQAETTCRKVQDAGKCLVAASKRSEQQGSSGGSDEDRRPPGNHR